MNWLATMVVRPHALPRMDFSSAIPDEMRTTVVVPSVLSSPEKFDDLLEGLEVRYLANRDLNLYFGLLTDLVDTNQEVSGKKTGGSSWLYRVATGAIHT